MSKKKIYRSGVIPYIVEGEEVKMLFMKPSDGEYGGNEFQLAKGKFEEGESAKEAGLREASEELGLFSGNIEKLTELGVFMGRTTVFVAKIKDKGMFGEPHFETEETKWLSEKEFKTIGRRLHSPVVSAAMRKIEKLEAE